MAQHGGKASTKHRLGGVLAVGLQESHSSSGLRGQRVESVLSFAQHRWRRVEQRHVVAGLGQRKRLMTGAATDVEHGHRGLGQVFEQLVAQMSSLTTPR